MWNQNQIQGMLIVFPSADSWKTLVRIAPRRIVATMVRPTSEKMAPRASFLRVEMRTPQRSQIGKAMTAQVNIFFSWKSAPSADHGQGTH